MGDHEILFGPFRLDCDNRQLWRGEQPLALQPKPLAVLQYLAQHAGHLISKEELLQHVWAGTQVTPKALTVCIHAIRATLGDSEATPQFIETQGKQGYRWIAEMREGRREANPLSPQVSRPNPQASSFVGREKNLAQLQEWYTAASAGTCTLGFVSGEAGIGKTTLVNQFVAGLRAAGQAWIGVGQGVQYHGTGEAYLPVTTVLSQFVRGAAQGEVRAVLQQHAPNWLVRLPVLRQEGENNPPAEPLPVVTPQRLMWELGETFCVLTERRPIVLVFDDLQWSDTATVEWLAYLARWPEPLRLLIIGTYRPADVIASGHPLHALTQELRGKGQSAELRLELLNKQQVHDYCMRRLPGSALPVRLLTLLYRRTDGHPLFLVRLLEYLVQQGFLIHTEGQWQLAKPVSELEGALPHELQGMIAQQVEQLSAEEQRVLEVGSVAGDAFASEVVAAGVALRAEQVEVECDALVRKEQVLEGRGVDEWPDGTITACYGFLHALFRDVVYRRLGEGRRIRLHRAIADRLEVGYGARAVEIAGALAGHWAQGRNYHKGAKYHQHAADNALRLSAYREAITHCEQGLGLLAHVPETLERDRQELALRISLHAALGATHGTGTQDVEENLEQALELARTANDEKALVSMVVALGRVYIVRSDRAGALRIAEEDARLLEQVRDPVLAILLHTQLGTIHTFSAEYAQASAHQTRVLTLYATVEGESPSFSSGLDPLASVYSFFSLSLWLAGPE
jgi:predicted ATPase